MKKPMTKNEISVMINCREGLIERQSILISDIERQISKEKKRFKSNDNLNILPELVRLKNKLLQDMKSSETLLQELKSKIS